MKSPETVWTLVIIFTCVVPIKGIILVNFTVLYEFVASDEIVILQNAIEDLGRISDMPVVGVSINSEDVPPKPVNISAKALSSTSIMVNWNPVNVTVRGNLTVLGYTVFYRRIMDPETLWNRIAVPSSTVTVNLVGLEPDTTYTIRIVAFHAMGNGLASEFIDERTLEGKPSEQPGDMKCESMNPYSITLQWKAIENNNWNGARKGYLALYRIFGSNSAFKEISFPSYEEVGIIPNLKPNSRYEIYLAAKTQPGIGPKSWCTPNTQEGVPSVGPNIINWELDNVRQDEAFITWDHIDSDKINGILTGYIVFYGLSRDGTQSFAYPDFKNITINDPHANSIVIKKIPIDVQLTVQIAGMTRVGTGEIGEPTIIESCTCPRRFYAAWFEKEPYVFEKENGEMGGIFPKFLNNMIKDICSGCKGLKGGYQNTPTELFWDRSKDGRSPLRTSEQNLKNRVEDNVHFHASVFLRAIVQVYQVKYRFVSIINSQGIAFIVRDPLADLDKTTAILKSLASCWPAILLILAFSILAGILIWVLDCEANSEEFPNENFFVGIYHGAYWAFVSMTTVGYGDKTPRSCGAQLATILWMLMGPIINGVVIGAITTSLTTISMESDPIIYGTKVGARNGTFEYNLGIRRNGIMDSTGKNFTSNEEMLEALESRVIDGVLIDSLEAASIYDQIVEKKLKISQLIDEISGWGIILSSDAVKIERQIRSYVAQQQEALKEEVENKTAGKLVAKTVDSMELDTGIVDPESQTFKDFLVYGNVALVAMIVIGTLYQCVFKRIRSNQVKPKSKVYKDLLVKDLAVMITTFYEELTEMIHKMSDSHESELKKFCWKKGYSFGIDGWFRQKNIDEEYLKKDIRYQEIMSQDLGLAKENEALKNWKKTKLLPNVVNAVRVEPIAVLPMKKDSSVV